jgi:branched-chain amino acid transport system substrate-binding protein
MSPRSLLLCASALAVSLALPGCGQLNSLMGTAPPDAQVAAPSPPTAGQAVSGATIGTGPIRIGLVLPLTGPSGPSVVGQSLRNAAELALTESQSADITLLVKDDRSTPDGAREATSQAIAEGAELVLGPLFANNLKEAGRVARSARRPIIGFSTDTSAAAPGVYELSFLIESYVDRIVDFAASKGKKSFAALVPESDYGNIALAEFQQAAARRGVRVAAVERYQPATVGAVAQKIASLGDQADALLIPDQADGMANVAKALSAAGLDSRKVQILGTGVWNDARVLKYPALQGAWFATPENAGFNAFAGRYRAKFGADPTRIATLSYDAVSLVAALARTQGSARFADTVLTNASGFNGADGVFRFRGDGQNDRGLAVLQIANGTVSTISPAPRSFGATATAAR